MFPFPGTALEGIFCIIPASLKRLLRAGSSGGTRSAAELTAACSASHKSQQCHRRLSQPHRCQHEPAQGKAAGFAQSETLQHPAGALASPRATRRDEGTPRGDSPGEDRRASSAGKPGSQRRQDEVVALEIIISAAIQINPSAVEPRAAGIIPGLLAEQGSPCRQHTQHRQSLRHRAGKLTLVWSLRMDLSPLGRSQGRPCSE